MAPRALMRATILLLAVVGHAEAARIAPSGHSQRRKQADAHQRARLATQSLVAPSLVQEKASSKQGAASSVSTVQGDKLEGSILGEVPRSSIIGKVPRFVLIVGIGASLAVVLFCTCCLMERCLSASASTKDEVTRSNSSKKVDKTSSAASMSSNSSRKVDKMTSAASMTSTSSMPRERKQHFHDGRIVYEWDQSDAVARVYINVPESLKQEDLDIMITSRHLTVGCKGKPAFLSEETCEDVIEAESCWRLTSSGELQIHLQKKDKAEWPYVLNAPETIRA